MTMLLEVEKLSVQLASSSSPLLREVALRVSEGESVGLVGESGSGKSLTARAILRLLPRGARVAGAVHFDGTEVHGLTPRELRAWRSTEVGIVFQDPRAHVNPMRTIGDFLTEGLRDLFPDTTDAQRAVLDMLKQAGIGNAGSRLRQYPHELSGGILQRVMIASVLVRRPRLLIADEPTTALDVTTQSDVMAIIEEERVNRGMAMLFISHDLDLAAAVCDRTAVMYAGSVVEEQSSKRLQDQPAHPYSAALMSSRPVLGQMERLSAIPGRPISGAEVAGGCSFAPRCPRRREVCDSDRPESQLVNGEAGHVACHFPLPITHLAR